MAAQLEATFEIGGGEKIIAVTLEPGTLNPGEINTEFADFVDTEFSGYTAVQTVLPLNSNAALGKWLVWLLSNYLVVVTSRENEDGTITRFYTVTPP